MTNQVNCKIRFFFWYFCAEGKIQFDIHIVIQLSQWLALLSSIVKEKTKHHTNVFGCHIHNHITHTPFWLIHPLKVPACPSLDFHLCFSPSSHNSQGANGPRQEKNMLAHSFELLSSMYLDLIISKYFICSVFHGISRQQATLLPIKLPVTQLSNYFWAFKKGGLCIKTAVIP